MNDSPQDFFSEISRDLFSSGVNLLQLNRIPLASFHFKKALSIDPFFPEAMLYLAHCLHLEKKFDEALALYDQLLLKPWNRQLVLNNHGNTLLQMRRYEDAAHSYRQALALAPELHDARVALATCLQALGRLDDAMAACNKVLSMAPGNAEAHWNKSLLLLLQGNYREGWPEYEWRWQKKGFTSPQRGFSQPRWNGEAANGKTLLIHAEQGFGDTLQFCRYLPLLADRKVRVILECHPPLVSLLKSLANVAEVIPMGQQLPAFDLHLPLLSLPLIFETIPETIPCIVPYLQPPYERLSFWHGQILDDKLFKVGICWAGKSYPDPMRSCPAEVLAPLAEIKGITWYSLQVGWEGPLPLPMNDHTCHFRDFSDTAALITQLDLVITIDTAVAHLAGALGAETWVMLPHAPDWRWMLEREDSPWYPSARLFRQIKPDSWHGVIQKVVYSLRHAALSDR